MTGEHAHMLKASSVAHLKVISAQLSVSEWPSCKSSWHLFIAPLAKSAKRPESGGSALPVFQKPTRFEPWSLFVTACELEGGVYKWS